MPLRPCPEPGCDTLTTGSRCHHHQAAERQARAKRRRLLEPHRRLYNTKQWRWVRAVVLARDGHACTRCGSAHRLEVHHRRKLADGGPSLDPANLITLCPPCHRAADHTPLAPLTSPATPARAPAQRVFRKFPG